jgi:hypothetical protein
MAKLQRAIATEHEEQCLFVQWFTLQFPSVRFFSVPNGGKRHKLTAVKLKREGASAGVPDLFFPAWKLFIEFKRSKGGKLSEAQKGWIEYLESVGYSCITVHGFDDCKQQIATFLDQM